MVYLLGIMLVASRYAMGASIVAAFLSVAAFNFFRAAINEVKLYFVKINFCGIEFEDATSFEQELS